MRNHSGHDVNSNDNLDPTLKEREGQGGPGDRPGTPDEGFEVAADHDPQDGKRSPSARGRGETSDTAATVPGD